MSSHTCSGSGNVSSVVHNNMVPRGCHKRKKIAHLPKVLGTCNLRNFKILPQKVVLQYGTHYMTSVLRAKFTGETDSGVRKHIWAVSGKLRIFENSEPPKSTFFGFFCRNRKK